MLQRERAVHLCLLLNVWRVCVMTSNKALWDYKLEPICTCMWLLRLPALRSMSLQQVYVHCIHADS